MKVITSPIRNLAFFLAFAAGVLPGFLPAGLSAQSSTTGQYAARYLTSREGLPQNSAYDMLQDEFGFVWIATQTGIARYDGRSFIEFSFKKLAAGSGSDPLAIGSRYDNFLCENTILREDTSSNILWVGSCASLYGISTVTYDYWPVRLNQDIEITGFLNSSRDGLILGSRQGLFSLEWKEKWLQAKLLPIVPSSSRMSPGSPENPGVTDLAKSPKSRRWLVGTQAGVEEMEPKNSTSAQTVWSSQSRHPLEYRANAVAYRSTGKGDSEIWAAGEDSIYIYPSGGASYRAIAQQGVNFMAPIRLSGHWPEDKMVLGTEYDGLILVDSDYQIEKPVPGAQFNWPGMIRGNQVRSSLVTRDGAVWVGTRGMGVTRVVEQTQPFSHHFQPFNLPGRIPNNYVWAIWRESENSKKVWLGTEGNGLARYDLDKRQAEEFFRVHPSPKHNIVKAITRTGDTLWLGGNAGLHYLLPEVVEPEIVRYDGMDSVQVASLWYEADARRLWIGTSGGRLYVKSGGKLDRLKLPQTWLVTYIGPGQGDSVMVATDHGFVQFPAGNRASLPKHGPLYLEDEHLKCVIPGTDSTFAWAGTVGNGLVRINRNGRALHSRYFSAKDGLPDPVVYGILPAESGSFWISTNRGLAHFFPERGIFINYNENDGLQHPEYNTGAFFKTDRTFHFGGVNGFNLFRETAPGPDAYLPQISLAYFIADTGGKDEKIIHFDTPADSAPAIRLNYDYQYIEWRIVSLQYQDFAKVNYKYRLYPEGDAPPEWTLLKELPDFTFSQGNGLSSAWFFPRRYVLEVWASDLLGGTGRQDANEPNGRTLRIAIAVDPPYWQTWWFILSILLVSLVILVLAFNLYRQNGRLLTRNNDLQTAYNNTASLADLNVIGQKIVASLSLEENFEAIMEEIRDLEDLQSDVFAVDLIDEKNRLLVSRLSIEDGQRLGNYSVSLDNPNSLGVACVRLASAGGEYEDGFLINDLSDRRQYPFLEGKPGVQEGRPTQATLFVPLRVGDRVLGAITVQSYAPDVYRPYHLNMLQILGAYIAIAIDHARTTEALLDAERAHTRAEQEDLIKALDIKLLRSQLSPHFIFNSLGTIQFLVAEEDPRADEYTAKLGEIMREVMTMITRSDIPLKMEAEFLRDYIGAEKIRFLNEYEFRWRLEIDLALDPASVFIPPMLLQPFIENSLEHAFYPLPEEGPEIRVFFGKMEDRLVIVMEDNGIGLGPDKLRKKEKHPRKNSTALQNIRRRAELINQLNEDQNQKMEIHELDLSTSAPEEICRVETWDLRPFERGARFELHLPLSFKFTATPLTH